MKRGAHRTPSRSSDSPVTPGVVTLHISKQVLQCHACKEHIILLMAKAAVSLPTIVAGHAVLCHHELPPDLGCSLMMSHCGAEMTRMRR